jgi:hypothetical protein
MMFLAKQKKKDKIPSESPTLFSPQNRTVAFFVEKESKQTWGDQRATYTRHFYSYWEEKKSGVDPFQLRIRYLITGLSCFSSNTRFAC